MTVAQVANPLTWLCNSCPIAYRLGECRAVHPKYHTKDPLKYLIVGEAPGQTEEKKGEPFVGKAGKKLRALLKAAKIPLDDCLLTNSCWCGPRAQAGQPTIDNPTEAEAVHCIPHSARLIARFRPQIIIAAGGVAANALCGKQRKGITKLRGEIHQLGFSLETRYLIFHLWQTENHATFAEKGLEPLPFWPAENTEERKAQLQEAVQTLSYDESWLQIPVMPVLHPSYVVRSGAGGKAEEALKFDLIKARGLVEQVDTGSTGGDYRWVNTLEEWVTYVDETLAMHHSGALPHISLDLETSEDTKDHGEIGLMAFDPETVVWTIQFSRASGEAVAVMANHRLSKFNDGPSFQQFRHHLERLISRDQPGHVPVIGQNITFDTNVLRCFYGIRCEVVGDTMLMGHFLTMGKGLSQGLDHLGARFLGTGMLHKSVLDDWKKDNPGKTFEDAPLDIALAYAAGDADVTFRVYDIIRGKLEEEGRWQAYYDIHHGLHRGWDVVNDMEWSGMPVEKAELDKLAEEYPRRIGALEPHLNGLTPIRNFNWARMLEYNAKIREFNENAAKGREEIRLLKIRQKAEGVPVTRKRGSQPKKLYAEDLEGFRDWMEDRDRWYNPNSVPQTVKMWRDVWKVPFYFKQKNGTFAVLAECDDIEWNDECPRCNRAPCKCRKGVKYVHQIPKANEHNRNVLVASFEIWAERLKNPPEGQPADPEGAQFWLDCADAIQTIDKYKGLVKMFGTYVGSPDGDKGIYPLIVDKPFRADLWEPSLRTSSLYQPYCEFPRPWSTHPSYLMHGTNTGRLSSERPNGQNYPKRKADPDPSLNVKRPYISHWAGQGGLIVQPDYSQIEVRVMVMMCQDEEIAKQINEGKDIHKVTASMVFGVPYEEVTKAQRGPCKNVTFGILYGQTVGALATILRITRKEAQKLVDRFFAGLPKVKAFVDGMHATVKQQGYVESLLGRRRYIPEVFEKDVGRSNAGLRMSVNTPIQSTASDLCWTAFGRSWQHAQRLGLDVLPYSIIHDSQGLDTAPGLWFDVVELMYYHMVYEPYQFWDWITVKPEADFEIGAGWGRLVEAKLFFDENENLDHNRIQFAGPIENIDAICVELNNSGQAYTVLEDHEHEKEEGPDGRPWWVRQISVGRSNPRCWLQGRQLIEAS